MVRKLEVRVPLKHSNKIRDVLSLQQCVHQLSYSKCITTDALQPNKPVESALFTLMVVDKKTHGLIELLTSYGVSSRFGSLNVISIQSTKPRVTTMKDASTSNLKKKRKYKISDRLAYDEVYETIDGKLHLTFDYLA
eukprot:539161_1